MNKWIGIGNLTADPEMRYTASGQAVTNFRIAINEGSGDKRTTEYVTCIAWEKLGERVAEYMRKGRKVAVEGNLRTRSWDGKDGKKRYSTEIICRNVEFLDRAADGPTDQAPEPDPLADLPF
jgi:single-strand DNA-binding protein